MQLTKIFDALGGQRLENNLTVTALLTLVAVLGALTPLPWISFPAALLLLTVLPGGQIVRLVGLFAAWRETRSLVLSIASGVLLTPIFLHWASLLFGFNRPLVFATLVGLTLGLAWLNDLWPTTQPSPLRLCDTRRQYIFLALLLLILLAALIVPYIEGRTSAGVYPVEMADWFKHYGVSWSIRYTGVPPADIFFYGDPARGKLAYYYFFHLTAATLDLLHSGPSSIYFSFVLLTLTVAVTFVLVFYVLARQVLARISAALGSLLFVTVVGGLDLIPLIPYTMNRFKQQFPGMPLTLAAVIGTNHVDGWAPAPQLRLNALYVHYLWVPQHVAGLLAFCLSLYFFREVKNKPRLLAVAPLLLLAMLGHSAWIALVGLACLGLYALFDLARRWRSEGRQIWPVFGAYALVAVCFLLVALPLLREISGPDAPKSGLVFEIPLSGSWPVLTPFRVYFANHWWTRLLDLLIHYFFELGALLVCGLAGWRLFRRKEPGEPLLPLLTLAIAVGFVTISCLASGRAWTSMGFTLNNDLGIRAIMPAQAALAIFAGYFLDQLWRQRWGWSKVLLGGFIGVMLGLGFLAFSWEFWAMGVGKYLKPPRVNTAAYRALQAMPSVTEPLSVVKHRTHDDVSAYQLMYGDRSPGFFTVEAAVFHPDLTQVIYQFGLSRYAFLNRLPVWSYQMFKEMYADYVYVGPVDRSADLYPEKFENPTYYEKVYAEDEIAIYKLRGLPLDRPQAQFAPAGVQFMGHIVDQAPVYPLGFQATSPQALVTAWRLEQPVTQDYTVYIHFTDASGQVVGQADHQLWTWAKQAEGPTSTWEAKRTYLDIIPLPPEVLAAAGPLQIGIGLWVPETGEYLQAETAELSFDANHRLIIGTFEPGNNK
ncbi:MAG: hypothetical protein BroJett011_44230 [Chloroflexota bacterium]|nr:MAG: hypothetical protein BroJett011_44230 [Chloroflexota bacterium]